MNAKSAVVVALLAIVAVNSFVNAAPGDKGSPCKYPCGLPVCFTHCSDQPCAVSAASFFSQCNAGLNCCAGLAPKTTPATTTTTTTAAPETTTTTTTTTPTTTTTTTPAPT